MSKEYKKIDWTAVDMREEIPHDNGLLNLELENGLKAVYHQLTDSFYIGPASYFFKKKYLKNYKPGIPIKQGRFYWTNNEVVIPKGVYDLTKHPSFKHRPYDDYIDIEECMMYSPPKIREELKEIKQKALKNIIQRKTNDTD